MTELLAHQVPVFTQLVSQVGQDEPVVEIPQRGKGDRDSPNGTTLYWYVCLECKA